MGSEEINKEQIDACCISYQYCTSYTGKLIVLVVAGWHMCASVLVVCSVTL